MTRGRICTVSSWMARPTTPPPARSRLLHRTPPGEKPHQRSLHPRRPRGLVVAPALGLVEHQVVALAVALGQHGLAHPGRVVEAVVLGAGVAMKLDRQARRPGRDRRALGPPERAR